MEMPFIFENLCSVNVESLLNLNELEKDGVCNRQKYGVICQSHFTHTEELIFPYDRASFNHVGFKSNEK